MTQTSDPGSPNMRLVELTCREGHVGVPILQRNLNSQGLGAYCAESRCHLWILWVPQTERWLALERYQQSMRVANPAYAAPPHAFVRKLYTDATCAHADCTSGPDDAIHNAPSERPETYRVYESNWIAAIADMVRFCHKQAEDMGFHSMERGTLTRAMLVVTELAELSEAARKGTLHLPSDHIPDFTNAEEEWADVLVRVFDHAPDDGVAPERLGQAFVAKLAYNRTRGYRHGGKTV